MQGLYKLLHGGSTSFLSSGKAFLNTCLEKSHQVHVKFNGVIRRRDVNAATAKGQQKESDVEQEIVNTDQVIGGGDVNAATAIKQEKESGVEQEIVSADQVIGGVDVNAVTAIKQEKESGVEQEIVSADQVIGGGDVNAATAIKQEKESCVEQEIVSADQVIGGGDVNAAIGVEQQPKETGAGQEIVSADEVIGGEDVNAAIGVEQKKESGAEQEIVRSDQVNFETKKLLRNVEIIGGSVKQQRVGPERSNVQVDEMQDAYSGFKSEKQGLFKFLCERSTSFLASAKAFLNTCLNKFHQVLVKINSVIGGGDVNAATATEQQKEISGVEQEIVSTDHVTGELKKLLRNVEIFYAEQRVGPEWSNMKGHEIIWFVQMIKGLLELLELGTKHRVMLLHLIVKEYIMKKNCTSMKKVSTHGGEKAVMVIRELLRLLPHG